jgi:hypothetical protein
MHHRRHERAAKSRMPASAAAGLKMLFITSCAENAAGGNLHLEPGMQVMTKPIAMEDACQADQGYHRRTRRGPALLELSNPH